MNTKQADGKIWKDAANKHFHRWAEHYDRDIINTLLFRPCHQRVMCQFRQWLRRGATDLRILDVGCGTGTLAIQLGQMGQPIRSVVGLDMSDNMILKARAKVGRFGLAKKVEFIVGDSENLPFDDNSFDVVTCCNSFHHYPHQDRAIAEMRRVLSPNGRVIVIDGCRNEPIGWFVFDICVERVEKHVHHCSNERFYKLLSDAGFDDIYQHVIGICPPAIVNEACANKQR